MKIVYIPTVSKTKPDLSSIKAKLPSKVLLFTTAQYLPYLEDMKKQIGGHVIKPKLSHTSNLGQILGCTKLSKDDVLGYDAILYVGDGVFHPIALSNDLIDVFCFNPRSKEFTKLDENYFSKIEKKKKLGLNKFYRSKEIGVLISTKFGQKRTGLMSALEKNYPDKHFYGIIFDTL
ncbi:MAG: diphthamide synthesis protein, partial [Candidatus Woesearchaeota archaeon]